MLPITVIISPEGWDEEKQEFVEPKSQELLLEHSLVSVSKWESKWKRSFLSKPPVSLEETIDYIKCMTLNKKVDENVYSYLSVDNLEEINRYINDSMTATYVTAPNQPTGKKEVVTSELIYCWMIALNIPVEFQKWHLNRLMTLIRVCEVKTQPQKKMSRKELMSRNAALNKARRQQLNSKG